MKFRYHIEKTLAAIARYARNSFKNMMANPLHSSLSHISDTPMIKKDINRQRRPLKPSLDQHSAFKRKADRDEGFLPTYDFDDPYLVKNSESFNLFYIQEEQIFKRLRLLGEEDRKKLKKSIYALKK